MRLVVEEVEKKVSVKQLSEELEITNANLTIVYKVRSDLNNYAFFSKTSHGRYGFRNLAGLTNKMTYLGDTIEESLNAAIKGGKELLVFDRDELDKLYKF